MAPKIENISDLLIIEPEIFSDDRGEFLETYNEEKYLRLGIPKLVQFNQSCSKRGVLRGLHYQIAPHAQGKLVSVISGNVQDVAVDLRLSSETFLRYFVTELSGENKKQLWIPPGFAHGFLVQSDGAVFQYGCSSYYSREHERGIIWNDPQLNIPWNITCIDVNCLSDKDKIWPSLKNTKDFF